uniref:Dynein light chain n=1 Tax=Cyanoptyche gloeocystis TaxID=77922 RepID=A0A7S2JQM3_9EUKA|mmetsp:Transcript_79/g.169  ORF Transcript_79/g.169 Transcript_79/m.169 type:complete len:134 (+) Transcript_79:95-496(+)|eukprot:CAMPEP_0196663434 /NCGR_PEP_ID=MMETSP1086-20130531/52876_1 /TAXON_ID=77921 /ORGANISM="Cyanoptyche  gloeocystis , Strain SAG4.97" /LENGTH=133 /DNA_ID=CAMNT_0041999251 /DNA_START=78 /DNA_END=479 /DNA_ORIENTATION=-
MDENYRPEPIKIVENTYKLNPNDDEKFFPAKVKQAIEDVYAKKKKEWTELVYDPRVIEDVSRLLSDEVKEKVKSLGFKRHKIIVQVSIGEMRGQGCRIVSRCLWDSKNDNYASATWQNSSVWISTLVFGTYYE